MDSLKMYNTEEVSKMLGCSRQQIQMYRQIGIIKSIKIGKNYMFSTQAILEFQTIYQGADLSNRTKATEAYNNRLK
jgi:DNA-binding transcriptional MerR regulator